MKKSVLIIFVLVSFCFLNYLYADHFDDGLILYYSFDLDPIDDQVPDESMGNHPGTITGALQVPTGKNDKDKAYYFDGSEDSIIAGDLGYNEIGSISFWMNPEVVENYRNPFSTDFAGWDDCIRFEEYSTGMFVWGALGFGSGVITNSLQPNLWYHVVFVWDDINTYAYLNGALVLTTPYPDPDSSVHPNIPGTAGEWRLLSLTFRNVAIGNGYGQDPNRWWKGLVDEVRIYNRVLDAYDVDKLYRKEKKKTK
ncbi:MAG: LamG domain-containing protein [Candidatus Aureabacteria bacterium]|nr:LamG domain-containing protein [Candidatus Auribacterota bacterium]